MLNTTVFRNIVLAYDGSRNSRKALDVAIDIARRYGASLHIVEVVDTSIFARIGLDSPIPQDLVDSMNNKARSDVEEARAIAEKGGIKAKGIVLEGDPATAILKYAEDIGADLIVSGSRGLSKIKKLLLGSVSSRIVHEARIPVLVVK